MDHLQKSSSGSEFVKVFHDFIHAVVVVCGGGAVDNDVVSIVVVVVAIVVDSVVMTDKKRVVTYLHLWDVYSIWCFLRLFADLWILIIIIIIKTFIILSVHMLQFILYKVEKIFC
jgi:hypothetical protein